MAAVECSAFSEDGKYFGYCGVDGKLKVWETETGVLSQEYTPDLHLSSPCTCLAWLASRNSVSHVEHVGNERYKFVDYLFVSLRVLEHTILTASCLPHQA
jgi:WD40 repeat protein